MVERRRRRVSGWRFILRVVVSFVVSFAVAFVICGLVGVFIGREWKLSFGSGGLVVEVVAWSMRRGIGLVASATYLHLEMLWRSGVASSIAVSPCRQMWLHNFRLAVK